MKQIIEKCKICHTRILKKTRKDCIYPSGAAMRRVYHFIANWGSHDEPILAKYFYYSQGDVGL